MVVVRDPESWPTELNRSKGGMGRDYNKLVDVWCMIGMKLELCISENLLLIELRNIEPTYKLVGWGT